MSDETKQAGVCEHTTLANREISERLRWLADRIELAGYRALPCRSCRRSGAIGVNDICALLLRAVDALMPPEQSRCRACGCPALQHPCAPFGGLKEGEQCACRKCPGYEARPARGEVPPSSEWGDIPRV